MADLPHNTGDGLVMAEEIGAASSFISTLYIGPHNHPHNEPTGVLTRRPHLILINKNGERFTDEALILSEDWGWMLAMAVDRQPDKICYAIMDEIILRSYQKDKKEYASYESQAQLKHLDPLKQIEDGNIVVQGDTSWLDTVDEDIRSEAEEGRVKIADNLDEIAKWIGCNPDTLKTTILEYNTYCRNQYDAEFLKDPQYLFQILQPPYYAFKGQSGIDTCIGGLRINHRLEVLNKALVPIKGLFAAGVATSGWLGIGYGYYGSEMSFTTYSGYAAGENAAKFVAQS
jgi:fumarate reductase flavoprotein subunit